SYLLTLYRVLSFLLYRPPRDLPSFPTRRSSDLGGIFHHSHVVIFPVARQIMGFFELNFFLALEIIGQASKAAAGGRFGGLANYLDRKSTRLNSSHVSISYAVFCLKKKKKT